MTAAAALTKESESHHRFALAIVAWLVPMDSLASLRGWLEAAA